MQALSGELRGQLERSIVAAREEAERAARAALETLGVERRDAFPGISEEDRRLRVELRARARQLGEGNFDAGIEPLVEEIAYEGWHRMLFARFLAENGLLIHPSGVAVTLEECADLARGEGEPDAWMVAARYASAMLPGIFRQDDPSARVRFAPEGRNALERILNELPLTVFQADDALGWVYQFWQSKAKKAVNESGVKIGAKELPAVTQLFTEGYMVRFLLENSLGAWWTARHPESPLIKEWEYLRFSEDGTPAAGKFEGWPDRAADVSMMDPCCGSGHFLVAAFDMLRKMRMEEEELSERKAGDAVLRDNVHGLEIDPRCTQIAAFALAFAAWKAGGYRELPIINVACSGIPVEGQADEWSKLAADDVNLRLSIERLHALFREAPTLGSLIDPEGSVDPLFTPNYPRLQATLQQALSEDPSADPVSEVFGAAAQGVARSAALLGNSYWLVATNVPYLTRASQSENLRRFIARSHPHAKANLATTFLERCRAMLCIHGCLAAVSPQNWLFQPRYESFRRHLLPRTEWELVARLGAGAFDTISGEVVNVFLLICCESPAEQDHECQSVDAGDLGTPPAKAEAIRVRTLQASVQLRQLNNPDARIVLSYTAEGPSLEQYAICVQGLATSDDPQFTVQFWEVSAIAQGWERLRGTVDQTTLYGGCERLLLWEEGKGKYFRHAMALKSVGRLGGWKSGTEARGKRGVLVSQMGALPVSFYLGEFYDHNASVIVPHNQGLLPAIWSFCSSADFNQAVRQIDPSLKPSNATLVKVPFDVEHWKSVADTAGPLPEPCSNDPTQWLFKGNPTDSTEPLQVAVVRLIGYRWPDQEGDSLDALADKDGIVPIVPVLNEQSAAERLRMLLASAFGDAWSTDKQDALLSQVGYGGKDLDAWLRGGFFQQHVAAKLFRSRPFIWHIWDGTRDGFSALVNYHKLDTSTLERLIYTYLGAWIDRQRGERDAGVPGAEGRLVAALSLQQKLIAIREGESPYDIYVRWKPKHEQPIGWDPDPNDGVRLNIRPFVEAGVLRSKFTINWNKDRGTNPDGTERLNDLHLTLAEKRAARAEAGVA